MAQVNVHEAKTNLSKLLDRAHGGEEIVVAKGGRPWARLVPLASRPERIAGRYPMVVPDSFLEPLADEELDGWQ